MKKRSRAPRSGAELAAALDADPGDVQTALAVAHAETALVTKPPLLRPGASRELVTTWLARYTSSGSRRALGEALQRAARLLGAADGVDVDWPVLEPGDCSTILLGLKKLYAPDTGRLTWTAVRGVLRHAQRRGELTRDRLETLLDQPPIRGTTTPPGRALDPAELAAVLRVATSAGASAARAGAVLALGYGGGLRRIEISRLLTGDVQRAGATAVLRVRGKGDKQRLVPINAATVALLERWMVVRGDEDGPVVCRLTGKGGSPVPASSLSPMAVWKVVRQFCKAAGIARASTHDLRRSFATDLFDAHEDLLVVQSLMGHASAETTRGYDRRPEQRKAAAVDKLKGLDGVLEAK